MNNEEIKKSEETELQKTEELSDEELNQVAGGVSRSIANVEFMNTPPHRDN